MTPWFFGYGSLVNTATHDYPNGTPATATGWRRAWVQTKDRPVAILTAVASEHSKIQGLVAEVPRGDWAALDLREAAYDRLPATENVAPRPGLDAETAIYAVPHRDWIHYQSRAPIVLSYLDVVIQGYLRVFGEPGVAHFIATTDGWDAPVLDDRANPRYPRAQVLTPAELARVDALLVDVGSTVMTSL